MKNTNFINLKKHIFKIQIVKMIIVLVYFRDWSNRMPIYAWGELYFFKESYSIRITQRSSLVYIHRKRLFIEINMLLQERSTFIFFPDRSWEQIFTGLSNRYAENIFGNGLIFTCQVRRSGIFRYVCEQVFIIRSWTTLHHKIMNKWSWSWISFHHKIMNSFHHKIMNNFSL